mmetsp:Transcript_20963/g.41959  ORF Transcript_20963/g.41959 Transcript_20963/m.41959 type:complete len:109 (-) Transcript_20963:243-569(-)
MCSRIRRKWGLVFIVGVDEYIMAAETEGTPPLESLTPLCGREKAGYLHQLPPTSLSSDTGLRRSRQKDDARGKKTGRHLATAVPQPLAPYFFEMPGGERCERHISPAI